MSSFIPLAALDSSWTLVNSLALVATSQKKKEIQLLFLSIWYGNRWLERKKKEQRKINCQSCPARKGNNKVFSFLSAFLRHHCFSYVSWVHLFLCCCACQPTPDGLCRTCGHSYEFRGSKSNLLTPCVLAVFANKLDDQLQQLLCEQLLHQPLLD